MRVEADKLLQYYELDIFFSFKINLTEKFSKISKNKIKMLQKHLSTQAKNSFIRVFTRVFPREINVAHL
jgi:hypothetical protein